MTASRLTVCTELEVTTTMSVVMNLDDLFGPSGIYANPRSDGRQFERPASLELINPDGSTGFQTNAGIRIRGGFSRDPGNPKHAFRFFFRSDHYNYARKGIPIIFFFDGVHEDYHRAGDTADKIDYQKMEKVTRTIYMTTWEIANRTARLKVDKPLPAQITVS